MNIHQLSRLRARTLAKLEALAGWDDSDDKEERRLHALAKSEYQRAERDYQHATSTMTQEEIMALTGKAA